MLASEVVVSQWIKPTECQVAFRAMVNNSERMTDPMTKYSGQRITDIMASNQFLQKKFY
jgi:hypothetical protein